MFCRHCFYLLSGTCHKSPIGGCRSPPLWRTCCALENSGVAPKALPWRVTRLPPARREGGGLPPPPPFVSRSRSDLARHKALSCSQLSSYLGEGLAGGFITPPRHCADLAALALLALLRLSTAPLARETKPGEFRRCDVGRSSLPPAPLRGERSFRVFRGALNET